MSSSRYTDQQKLEIFRCFERNNKSIVLTQRELQRNFGIRPSKDTIKAIHNNLITHQRFSLEHPGQPRRIRTEDNIQRVRNLAEEHEARSEPTSTRRLALEMRAQGHEISTTSVHRILRDEGFRGYHERRTFEQLPGDGRRRVDMARSLLEMIDDDDSLLERIIWTDEAKFELSGAVNSHNTIYWSRQNPHMVRQTRRVDQRGIMIWAGIHANGIIGPYEIEGRLTGEKYHDMLEEQILPNIDTSYHWWMQDGAPAHGSSIVKNLLHQYFEDRVIALGWNPEWAPRSPDLTPCDFHLWGEIKNKVYGHQYRTLSELKSGIIREFDSYDIDMIRRACLSVKDRLEDVIALDGAPVQFQRGR